jgi:parallel beta-helix repeat protein
MGGSPVHDPTRPSNRRWRLLSTALVGVVVLLAACEPGDPVDPEDPGEAEAVVCDRWAATGGDDAAAGTQQAPWRSLHKLASGLQAGQTGCLPANQDYDALGGYGIVRASGGLPASPVTIRSGPGGRARVRGLLRLDDDRPYCAGCPASPGAHDIVFTDLDFVGPGTRPDGSLVCNKCTYLDVDGDRITFRGNDITNPFGICVDVGRIPQDGPDDGRRSAGVVLEQNRIHGCGMSTQIIWTDGDSGAHAVYIQDTTGVRVVDNLIHDNRYRGVQLYPNASGTVVANNVLDANATHVNIGSSSAFRSTGTTVRDNIMTNRVDYRPSKNPSQVYGFFPALSPTYGNVVTANCVDPADTPALTGDGYEKGPNVAANPGYLDRTTFRLPAGSPCTGKGPVSGPYDIQPSTVPPTCLGRQATLVGTAAAETLTGTAAPDVIVALGGADVIRAGGGDDLVCGGDGADQLFGEGGYDELQPGTGDDLVDGDGADGVADLVDYSDAGAVTVDLVVRRGTGATTGTDTLASISDVRGSVAGDVVTGDNLNNYLQTGGGADVVADGGGGDVVDLGAGDDRVTVGTGRDVLRGGPGVDAIEYGRPGTVRVSADGVADDGEVGEGDDVATDVEQLRGGPGDDVLKGQPGGSVANLLVGGEGHDRIYGFGGDDVLYGDALGTVAAPGRDELFGGDGADELRVADGIRDTTIDCGTGTDAVHLDAADPPPADCEVRTVS